MATIGLKHVVYSPLSESTTAATYTGGGLILGAITAEIATEANEAALYGDDKKLIDIKEFKQGTISLNTAGISDAVYAYMLGHSLETIDGAQKKIVSAKTDKAPYIGLGFCAPDYVYDESTNDWLQKYTAIWLKKVKFSEPAKSMQTNGDSIEFKSPTIEGTFIETVDGEWVEQATFATESAATDWLDTLANLAANVATPVADVAGGQYDDTQTIELSCATGSATIKYSIDGAAYATYTTGLTVAATTVLRFYAEKAGMNTSPTVTEIYEITA